MRLSYKGAGNALDFHDVFCTGRLFAAALLFLLSQERGEKKATRGAAFQACEKAGGPERMETEGGRI